VASVDRKTLLSPSLFSLFKFAGSGGHTGLGTVKNGGVDGISSFLAGK
jgi:hypothetical protein